MLVPVTIRGDNEESRLLIIIKTSVNTSVLICITFVLGTRQNKCFGRVLVIFFLLGGSVVVQDDWNLRPESGSPPHLNTEPVNGFSFCCVIIVF